MIFEYKNKRGQLEELDYPIGQAPDRVKIQGVVYRRCIPTITVLTRPTLHFTSHVVGLNHKDAPRVDKMGRALFDGKREKDEFQAKNPEFIHTRDD